MKSMDLLAAIGTADEKLLRRSEKKDHRAAISLAAAAACFCVAVTAFFGALGRSGSAGIGSSGNSGLPAEDAAGYDVYVGPVLPLTLREDNGSIQASRAVSYDFSGVQEARQAAVEDTYTLTNTSDQPQTLSLLYPVETSYWTLMEGAGCQVQVDGAPVEYELLDGAATSYRLEALPEDGSRRGRNWEDFVSLLEDGSYLAEALGEIDRLTLDLSTPAYTYRFSGLTPVDVTLQEGERLDWAVKCGGWTVGTDFYGMEDGWSFADGTQDLYLTSIGGELTDLQYRGHTYERGLFDVTATVTIQETTLGTVLEGLVSERVGGWTEAGSLVMNSVKKDMQDLYEQYGNYFYNGFSNVISAACTNARIFYLAFEVTVPAGGSRTVSIAQVKAGSHNIDYEECGAAADGYGYDMMTALGSNLNIIETQAALLGYDTIRLRDQNFGFDPQAGITEVTLDPSVSHYYMIVERKEAPEQTE